MKLKLILVLFFAALTLFASAVAQAGTIDYYSRRMLQARDQFLADAMENNPFALFVGQAHDGPGRPIPKLHAGTFAQRVDHSNPNDHRQFTQRYYLDATFALGPDSPVLYMLCGEAVCTERELGGAPRAYAEKEHAFLIALEHRYYGKSQPFPALTTANLQYLTVANALADLANFKVAAAHHFNLRGKWIAIGGSYSGALAAFFREKYPRMIHGAIASSGPVRAKADFEEYDLAVRQAAGPSCADRMLAVTKVIEAKLATPASALAVKKLFLSENVANDIDFLYVVADMGAAAVQYGMKEEFCNQILNAADPLESYAIGGIKIFKALGETPEMDSFDYALSTDPAKYADSIGVRQWMYQSCREFGFYQVAYHNPALTTRSTRIDLAYHNQVCERLFGITTPVNTARTNQRYLVPILRGALSNVLFTNGSTDPWARLSITHAGSIPSPTVWSYVVNGGSHCSDLRTPGPKDNESLKNSRFLSETAIGEWFR